MPAINKKSGQVACRSGSMTLAQQAALKQQKAQGFAVIREENNVVLISKGNDFRVIWTDGSVRRAHGAKS